jgi:hypothetical protein
MRCFLCAVLFGLGALTVHFCFNGVLGAPPPEGGRRTLSPVPILELQLSTAAALAGAIGAMVFAALLWPEEGRKECGKTLPAESWSRLFHILLSWNVLFVALMLAAVVFSVRSALPAAASGGAFFLALAGAGLGAVLVTILWHLQKARVLFTVLVAAHVAELGSLAVMYAMGSGWV